MLAGLDALHYGSHDIAIYLCWDCSLLAGVRGKDKGRNCPGSGFHQ